MKTIGVKSRLMLFLIATCLFFVLLTGCGTKKYDKTTLEFAKTGDIDLHIVDEFDESLYSIEELSALNEAEINVYNSYGKGKVVNKGCAVDNGIIRIDIRYDSDDAYFDMNNVVLFYGDADSAKNAGYNLIGKVTSTEGNGTLNQSDWNGMSLQKVVAVSEEIEVVMPGKILYVGDGVTLTSANSASVSGEGMHYIICE